MKKRARMEIVHWRREAYTLKRRNSLSIGAPATLVAKLRRDKLSDQAASPLFSKIPGEIRAIIYVYALTDAGAINWMLVRDWHHRFTVPRAFSCLPTNGDPVEDGFPWERWKYEASGRALLRTCRRIYTEAIPILYSKNQFRFEDGISLHAFAAITPTSMLKNIRSLRIDGCSGMRGEDMLAVIRLPCWENLRVIYIAHHWPISDGYDPFEIIATEAETLKNCVFHFLLYENEYHSGNPHVKDPADRRLLSYKYVDPRADPNWRSADWRTVTEV